MSNNKKYQIKLEQKDSEWVAQITRQVTSRKIVVTKQQDSFTTETEAQEWAAKL